METHCRCYKFIELHTLLFTNTKKEINIFLHQTVSHNLKMVFIEIFVILCHKSHNSSKSKIRRNYVRSFLLVSVQVPSASILLENSEHLYILCSVQ
jgi:hypothetical protein